MTDISVVGSAYDTTLTSSYYMSIRLYPDGLSFSVFDPVTNTFVAYGDHVLPEADMHYAKQEELMLTNDIFKAQYKGVLVSVHSDAFTMVPSALYRDESAPALLKFVGNEVPSDAKCLSDNIELASAVTVYALSPFLYYFLQTQFRCSVKVMHYTTPIIETMLAKRGANATKATINLSFSGGKVAITAIVADKLKLCNEHTCREATDMVYVVMYTIEQLGLSNDEVSVVVSGNIDAADERITLLQRYARNVSMAQLPSYFNYGFSVAEPHHKFYNLFIMSLCV